MMHQRISKKIIIYLFIFFSLVTITNTRISDNFYIIKELNISGLNNLETNKIYNDLRIFQNSNIFSFDKKDISEKIYSNKIVEKFEIFKIYPSTLNIEIKETKFLAITKKNNNNYLIGENGNLIKANNTFLNLPFIFGNVDVKDFLYLKEIVEVSNFKFNNIKNLYYFKSNRWDIITKDGLTYKMPTNLTIKKLNLIKKITQANDFNDSKIFDYRQNNMMVINE